MGIDYLKHANYKPVLKEKEMIAFYHLFINDLLIKLKEKYQLTYMNITVAEITNNVSGIYGDRTIFFEELFSNNYFKINNNLIELFFNQEKIISIVNEQNKISLINSIVHDRINLNKTINTTNIIFTITNKHEIVLEDFYVDLANLINETLMKVIMQINKNISESSLQHLRVSLNDYKKIETSLNLMNFLEGFKHAFKRTIKANQFVYLKDNFFKELDYNARIYLNYEENKNLNKSSLFCFQKKANDICKIIDFYNLKNNNENNKIYVQINIVDLIFYLLNCASILEIFINEATNEEKTEIKNFKID